MMEVLTKCGRCGALVETRKTMFADGTSAYYAPCAAVTEISSNNTLVRDGCETTVLCPDCMEVLKGWLACESQEAQGQEKADQSADVDSVERLAADMARALACTPEDCCGIKIACEYFGHSGLIGCRDRESSRHGDECPASGFLSNGCWETMCANIRRRCAALGIDLEEGEDAGE